MIKIAFRIKITAVIINIPINLLLFKINEKFYSLLKGYSETQGINQIGIVCAISVGAASYNKNYFAKTGVITKIFLWIGSRSYSIYLNHIIIFIIIRDLINTDILIQNRVDFVVLTACAISVSCLLAEINYRFVEMPLRLKGRQIVKSLKN